MNYEKTHPPEVLAKYRAFLARSIVGGFGGSPDTFRISAGLHTEVHAFLGQFPTERVAYDLELSMSMANFGVGLPSLGSPPMP